MFFVRLVSFLIFIACFSSQAHTMIFPTSRAVRRNAKNMCSGPAPLKCSNLGLKILAGGGIGIAVGSTAWFLYNKKNSENQVYDIDNKKAAMQAVAELFLVENKDLEGFIKYCLNEGMNPNDFVMYGGRTALMVACESGNSVVVKILVEEWDVDLNAQDMFGRSALSLAIAGQKNDIVSFLLDQKSIDTNTEAVQNVLYRSNHPKIKEMFNERAELIMSRMKQYSIDENRR